jgi:hypothetical protein
MNLDPDTVSQEPTPYRVICHYNPFGGVGCGPSYLTYEEYLNQMSHPNSTWRCPKCGAYDAEWDDDNYERMTEPDDEELLF